MKDETHVQLEQTMPNVWEISLQTYIIKHHIREIFSFSFGFVQFAALHYSLLCPFDIEFVLLGRWVPGEKWCPF